MVTTISKAFLALVGTTYIALGIWCAVAPEKTSKTVGFTLTPGSGQSEFLTVYGGLEVALGLLFLWPFIKSDEIAFPLAACLVVHLCLVLFRTIGFFVYSGFASTTYTIAVVEWMIFLVSAVLWLSSLRSR